ncbi:hypothetical protein AB0H07_38935 [Streptomyces sp. NPDC021354]|uniref:hypothetical protein n=1 Tax=Streptomyces sp. NPDC021354 TaxID=3154793 RepID=UPI0033D89B98
MSTPEPLLTWGEIPEGTQWPDPDTLVLLNRELRPGTDMTRLSRFREDQWDLNAAIFEDHMGSVTVNFARLPSALRPAAKFYVWQLLNHTEPRRIRGSGGRIAVLTVGHVVGGALQYVLKWLAGQAVTAFCQVTEELLDAYLDHLAEDEVPVDACYRRITEIRRLWAYRDILPPGMRLPDAPPWAGEDTQDLLGRRRGYRENRTRRIGEITMQMTLRWAIRFVEDFSDDILVAHAEYLELHHRMPEWRRVFGTQMPSGVTRHRKGELARKTAAYLDDLRKRGEALPGTRREDGHLEIRWRYLAAILDCTPESFRRSGTGRLVTESGLPIAEHTYLGTVTGLIDGQPWRRDRIHYEEAPRLARLLATACFIIVAYLSGARPGEALNLRRGCITHDKKTSLWLMEGIYFKGAEDEDGNKIPEGEPRPDPWVVIEIVARAVAVMERLHPRPLIFPSSIEPHYRHWDNTKRHGHARTLHGIHKDLTAFVTWVNSHCENLGRTDAIPPDRHGSLAPSRFRRTLAWFIRRRPRGLIAASIQYGHAFTRMLQGYAGTYESGFPDEYAFEDWLFRMEGLAEDEQALAAGEHVSGPAADAYRYRVTAASREFAGRVLTSDRQASDLLGDLRLQIHHGQGMTCVLNPATAACHLRGAADDPMVTPDLDDCRPKCPNIARTDRDIEHVRQQAAELRETVADLLAPPIRHDRDRRELVRLEQIIEVHQQGAAAP